MKVHVIISGIVQGVWFRKYTCQKAIKLNLTGYVRNEPGGGVYVEAEGKEDQLLGRLQQKLGKSKEEVKSWIDSL